MRRGGGERERCIGRMQCSLHRTYVGALDHVDVVGTVTDGEGQGARVVAHEADDIALLGGGHAAADDDAALAGKLEQGQLEVLLEAVPQRGALDHQSQVLPGKESAAG